MKLLHTSDWHIGRRIENITLLTEFELFIHWLTKIIEQEQIDALIVAGDIFDTGMPSIAAQEQYYKSIAQLANTRLKKIIIINGNHDSANFLLAPKIILKTLKTFISASLPQNLNDIILPLPDENTPEIIIAAVPYLRDIDIINYFKNKAEQIDTQHNIAAFYQQLVPLVQKFKNQGLPLIATGHLFVSDSTNDTNEENDYTLGGLIDIHSDQLPEIFDYYALGHIHRPWSQKNKKVYYCGSPFPMSLNDVKNKVPKGVNIIDSQNITNIKRINTPLWRHIEIFEGPFDEIQQKIKQFQNKGILSPAYGYVRVTDYPDNIPVEKLHDHLSSLNTDNLHIIKAIFPPKYSISQTNKLQLSTLKEYSPRQILEYHLDNKGYSQETKKQILETFDQLLTLYRQNLANN